MAPLNENIHDIMDDPNTVGPVEDPLDPLRVNYKDIDDSVFPFAKDVASQYGQARETGDNWITECEDKANTNQFYSVEYLNDYLHWDGSDRAS